MGKYCCALGPLVSSSIEQHAHHWAAEGTVQETRECTVLCLAHNSHSIHGNFKNQATLSAHLVYHKPDTLSALRRLPVFIESPHPFPWDNPTQCSGFKTGAPSSLKPQGLTGNEESVLENNRPAQLPCCRVCVCVCVCVRDMSLFFQTRPVVFNSTCTLEPPQKLQKILVPNKCSSFS